MCFDDDDDDNDDDDNEDKDDDDIDDDDDDDDDDYEFINVCTYRRTRLPKLKNPFFQTHKRGGNAARFFSVFVFYYIKKTVKTHKNQFVYRYKPL